MRFLYASMFHGNIKIINHAEDLTLKNSSVMNEGVTSTKLGLKGSPDITESNMVLRDLEIAKFTNSHIHVPHVSAGKSVKHINSVKKDYDKVTAEVTPHHLFFSDEDLQNYNTNLKVAPPIRTRDDRKILINALKDGTIDCIATDHAPHALEEKECGFNCASFGMIGLESCYGAVNKILFQENNFNDCLIIKINDSKSKKNHGF